jgi:hypothetical protein
MQTKNEFSTYFKTHIEPGISSTDKPALRQAWNDTIDVMCKGNELPERARDWSHPARFYYQSERPAVKRKKVYSTLEEIYSATQGHQVTAQELLNGRTQINGVWGPIELTEELRKEICTKLSDIFGGRAQTKTRVFNTLLRERRQNWGLSRVFLEKYPRHNIGAHLHYCAGQDMPSEIRQIRKELL